MRMRIFCLVLIFVTSLCFGATKELIDAVKCSCVPDIQHLIEQGAVLTAPVCEVAGKRDAVAQYLHLYLKNFVERYRREQVVVGLSRAEVYTCLSALLLHVRDVHLTRSLLLLGARIDYKDGMGNTALSYALSDPEQEQKARVLAHERENIYEQLVAHVQQKTLTKEFLHEYFSGINRLSIDRPYAQLEWRTVLMCAVMQNYYEGVLLLLNSGAAGLNEALLLALHRSDKKIIQLLINRGARLRAIPGALRIVVTYNPYALTITRWLAPLVYKHERNHALLDACLKGDLALVELLIRQRASLYYDDEHGVTPLYAAVIGHNLAVVKTIAAHKNMKLTSEQLDFAKTFFPQAYEFLISTNRVKTSNR